MKKFGAEVAHFTPDAQGWRVRLPGSANQTATTLEEAIATVPAEAAIHLALPAHLVLLERLTLPALDREELAGMVLLQLEKTLPYPVEDAASDFEIISQNETESTVLSVATQSAQLDAVCEPFRLAGRLPERITLFAMHVAASCPPNQTVLSLWTEEGQIQMAIAENSRLSFSAGLSGLDADALASDLPRILLTAELEGVSMEFAHVRLEENLAALREPLGEIAGAPVELFSLSGDALLPEPDGNLAPAAWRNEVRRLEKAARLRQQLQVVAMVYLVLVAVAFVYLAWLKSRVQKIDAQLAAAQPQIEFVLKRRTEWAALAPAIDPSRYLLEILYQVYTELPGEGVNITVFQFSPMDFRVEGEAPTHTLALAFEERLRSNAGLAQFNISAPQPTILPNASAHYNISGKL